MIDTYKKKASSRDTRNTGLTGRSVWSLFCLLSGWLAVAGTGIFASAVATVQASVLAGVVASYVPTTSSNVEIHHLEAGAAIELSLPQPLPEFLIVRNAGIDAVTEVIAANGQPLRSHGSWRNREGRYVVALGAADNALSAPASLRIRSSETHAAPGSVRLQWLRGDDIDTSLRPLLSAAASGSALIMSPAADAASAAAEAFAQAVTTATSLQLPVWQADLRYELAATGFAQLGLLVQSGDLLQQVISGYRQLDDQRGVAAASNLLGLVWLNLGRMDDAMQQFRSAIALRETQTSDFYLAEALNNLALAHWRQDLYAEAGKLYEQALQTLIQRDDLSVAEFIRLSAAQTVASYELSLVAATLNNLALVQSSSGDLDYAESAWLLAHQLAERTSDRTRMGQIEKNLGWLYQRQGRLQQALAFLQQALEGHVERQDDYWIGETLTILGDLFASIGEYETAITHYEDVVELSSNVTRREAFVISQMAEARWKLQQESVADSLFKQALDLVDANTEPGTYAVISSKYAMLQLELNQTTTALAAQQQAVAVLDQIGNLREAARARSRYGRMLIETGDTTQARQVLELALTGHRQVADELFELETLLALSYTRDDATAALQDADQAATLALAIDAGSDSEMLQLSFMQTVHAVQGRYIDLLLANQQVAEAFLAAERIRARDLLAQFQLPPETNTAAAITALQASLPDDTVLLSYFLGARQSHLWLLSADGLQHHQLAAADDINSAAAALADILRQPRQSPGKIDWLCRRLSELVLQPVAAQLRQRQVVIVADGNLQLVPFNLLPLDPADASDRDLLTRYTPSASVFAALSTRPARALQSLLVLADPMANSANDTSSTADRAGSTDGMDQLLAMRSARQAGIVPERLPGARLEAQQIASVAAGNYRVNLRLGADANRRFIGHGGLRHHDIVHFATHGVIDTDLPALSALVLAPEQGQQPTYLYPREIRELQLNADLVVLSGCDTGIGKAVAGHGLMSLSRPFLAAGARQVVASLWQVSDQATAVLMERFYRNLLNDGQAPQLALQSAQQWMQQQERWSHPYFWAGFIISGA